MRTLLIFAWALLSSSHAWAIARHDNVTVTKTKRGAKLKLVIHPETYDAVEVRLVSKTGYPAPVHKLLGRFTFTMRNNQIPHEKVFDIPYDKTVKAGDQYWIQTYFTYTGGSHHVFGARGYSEPKITLP